MITPDWKALTSEKDASDGEVELSVEYALDQNYPNPFNPVTLLSFALPTAGHVKVEIYDIVGRRVATLVDRYRDAGHHTVEWSGDHFASGIYLYRLSAGDFVKTGKMILLT